MSSQQNLAERSMAVGLRALNRLAGSGVVDRLGLREPTERFLHGASKTTMRTAARAGRKIRKQRFRHGLNPPASVGKSSGRNP